MALVNYCNELYKSVVEKNAPIVQSVKSIVKSIVEYATENNLDVEVRSIDNQSFFN